MAKFKISKAINPKKTWKAVGINPLTNKKVILQGGQNGVKVGKKNPKSEKSFDARHEATLMTPTKYINKLRWDDLAKIGSIVDIPDKLFTK